MSRRIRRALVGATLSVAATAGLVAGTAGTAHAAGPVYSVQLNWLNIADNQDNNSVDEVYIKVNGSTVWGPRDIHWNTPENLNISLPRTFYFDGTAPMKIEFWDRDPGRDDRVGTITLSAAAPNVGPNAADLKGNDGEYWVYYTVTQIA
ncbi:hypothetical protein [Yinghuangia seranimata]|uniref:hypothetical protein n=1 Tax=Yinghuangia seranimata TaxID=408067 RepID=UPI00248D1982|nr:hypothetical protein [Yinghuangia seranimata]MDI2128550.1 hypothetical protein [Yinghuangia seranimata]